ncbi:hypothetical protein [Bacillus toyonensis]|uniref:hypothetical protein n=1 Tax=Bacillus toyonensis TaxID=155322 RepID=UPI000BF58620|nr:hypothetical protein [Bacillus toyonensis]PGF05262.1 hypothetical protein COM61_02290 [Bacillus toyonensis]
MTDGFDFKEFAREHAQLTHEVHMGDYIIIHVQREEVEGAIYSRIMKHIRNIDKRESRGYASLIITFNGYDDIPDSVFEIMDIRKYVQGLFSRVPHLLFYMANMPEVRENMLLCICDFQKLGANHGLSYEELLEMTLEDPDSIPKEQIVISISDSKRRNLAETLRKYGNKVKKQDEAQEVIQWLNNTFSTDNRIQ